jgi:hypothetical protein
MSSDLANAKAEADMLRRNFSFETFQGTPLYVPIAETIQLIQRKPEALFLLKKEAEAAGVRAGVDQIGSMMRLYQGPTDEDSMAVAKASVADLLVIINRFQQVSGYSKVTKPAVTQELAELSQKVSFNVVPISADLYLPATTKPTDAAMQKQFDQYAAIPPGTPTEPGNPFGFGYRLPVKQGIQYLQYNRDDLEKGVIARTDYEWPSAKTPVDQIVLDMKVIDHYWRVAGQKFYLDHPDKFTKPLTTDGPGVLEPIGDPDVLADAIRQVRDPMIDALDVELRRHLTQTLEADWKAWQAWLVGGSQGPEPVTAVGVPYDSADYLPKLAAAISKDPAYLVPVTAGQSAGDVTDDDAATTKPYGSQQLEIFAITTADQYLKAPDPKSPAARAELMKCSDPLESYSPATTMATETARQVKTVDFARLTDVQPSVAPASLAAVAGQVEKDLRTVEAYQLAQDDAEKLLAETGTYQKLYRGSSSSSLKPASLGFTKFGLKTTGAMSTLLEKAGSNPNGQTRIDYMLEDAMSAIQPPKLDIHQQVSFLEDAYAALGTYNAKTNPHPTKIVKIPAAAAVYVVEVDNVTADWSAIGANQFYIAALNARAFLQSEQAAPLAKDWFDYEKLAARMGYKPLKG